MPFALTDISDWILIVGGIYLAILAVKFFFVPWKEGDVPQTARAAATGFLGKLKSGLFHKTGGFLAESVGGAHGRHWFETQTGGTTLDSCKQIIGMEKDEISKMLTQIMTFATTAKSQKWDYVKISTTTSAQFLGHVQSTIISHALSASSLDESALRPNSLNGIFSSLKTELGKISRFAQSEQDPVKKREIASLQRALTSLIGDDKLKNELGLFYSAFVKLSDGTTANSVYNPAADGTDVGKALKAEFETQIFNRNRVISLYKTALDRITV